MRGARASTDWPAPFVGGQIACMLWMNSDYARWSVAQGLQPATKLEVLTPAGARRSLMHAKEFLEASWGPASLGELVVSGEDPTWKFSWTLTSWPQLVAMVQEMVVPWISDAQDIPGATFVYLDPASFRIGLETTSGWRWFLSEAEMEDESVDLREISKLFSAYPSIRGPRFLPSGVLASRLAQICELP